MMEDTKRCPSCGDEISISVFILHQIHCERFLFKCPIWGIKIPKSDIEKHNAEEHAKQPWPYCNLLLEPDQLGAHIDTWEFRPKPCQYCNAVINHELLQQHEEECGARTEFWSVWHSYVLVKEWPVHVSICDPEDVPEFSYDEEEYESELDTPEESSAPKGRLRKKFPTEAKSATDDVEIPQSPKLEVKPSPTPSSSSYNSDDESAGPRSTRPNGTATRQRKAKGKPSTESEEDSSSSDSEMEKYKRSTRAAQKKSYRTRSGRQVVAKAQISSSEEERDTIAKRVNGRKRKRDPSPEDTRSMRRVRRNRK